MYYVIKSKTGSTPDETVQAHELDTRISALAGRNPLTFKSVRARLRERGRVYIATAKGSPARETHGVGFLIERVDG